ncbi:MAG TPA: S9 family peptidase [Gemmatimonadaceae bacterium]
MLRRMIAILVLCAPLVAQGQAKRPFTPADWYRLTTLSQPAMSPDGRLVAFTVMTINEAENARHREVWVVPTSGGEPQRFTAPGYESSNPRWSPDGKWLLFTSEREGSRARTWGIRMDQPAGEAVERDDVVDGSMPRNRQFVVYSEPLPRDTTASRRANDPFARMQPMARPPFGAITRPLDPRRFDGRHIVDMRYKANGRGFVPSPREAREIRPSQLWISGLDGENKRILDTTRYSRRSPVVSPDGEWIAYIADPEMRPDSLVQAIGDSLALLPYDRRRDEAPRNDADLFVVSVRGGAPQRVTTANGSEGNIQWSPDSRYISFVAAASRTAQDKLYMVERTGGRPVDLLGDWQYEPGNYWWTPDGQIMVAAPVGGRTALFKVNPTTRQRTEVIGGRRRITGFTTDERNTKIAFVATSVTSPTELYVANADGSNEVRLTGFNDKINAEIEWPEAERFTYKSVGGLEIEAWLQKPAGYRPGQKYPLVLYIHGGPHSAYGEGWFDEFHNITGAGMFVLYTNPRGSSGYGADFTFSTRGRWGLEDYEDLMRAVDIVAARPDVDSTRMGVTGGSYGGFMTAWITTRTNRFKAAQTDRMISNWWSWWGTSDVPTLTEFEFYGKPWENAKTYDELSPIRFVHKVRTPTLIVQSEEDHRTPMGDAEQWFMALKKQGVPVEFVRYPRSTHDLSRTGEPWLLVDRLARLRQWFEYWLKGESATTTSESGR